MLKRIFLIVLIFSLLIVNIDGETIWEQDFDLGSINVENKVSTATTNPITIHQSGEVMITLTGKIPENSTFQNYIVCISYGAEPLNEPSSWEKGGCISQDPNNLYFELSDATQFNINLRDNTLRDIFVSVSVDDLSALNPIDNVKLKLTGLDCGDYAINVKGICFGYYNLTRGNLYSYNTKAEDWSYFAITIPSEQNTSYAIFKNYLNSNFYSNNPQESYIRYGAPPTNEIYDQKGVPSFNDSLDIEIALDSPIPGNYIIGVYNKNDTVVSSFYVWEYSTCKSGEAGPNCDDPVISLKNQSYLGEQTIQPGKWVYYIVEANDSLIFYTIANNETDNAPNAYARLIGFPSSTSYNIASTGKRINILDSSEIPTTSVLQNFVFDNQKPSNKKITRNWYIGLFNPTLKNITFGTWINTECPNSCENNGKCEDHLCLCNKDKDVDAITCASTHEGFKVEYIILIVVGSCIILTGIIGIIVYLHRRRNRHTYESF